jgi:hypothetical protein
MLSSPRPQRWARPAPRLGLEVLSPCSLSDLTPYPGSNGARVDSLSRRGAPVHAVRLLGPVVFLDPKDPPNEVPGHCPTRSIAAKYGAAHPSAVATPGDWTLTRLDRLSDRLSNVVELLDALHGPRAGPTAAPQQIQSQPLLRSRNTRTVGCSIGCRSGFH